MLVFCILKLSVGINTKTPGAGCTKGGYGAIHRIVIFVNVCKKALKTAAVGY